MTLFSKKESWTKPSAIISDRCQIQLKKVFVISKTSTSMTKLSKAGNSLIFYSFKPFIIWNFAITKRFFRGTYFIKVFLLLLFFSETALLFILNFYHALKSCLIMEFTNHIRLDIIISLWLSLSLKLWIWYRRENKVEKFYNHDGQKIGFYKKVHIKRYRLGKNKDILLVLCIAWNEKKI